MLKKYTAILMMFTAYVILLGHGIIPHHHHDNSIELIEHHDTYHQHDGKHRNEGLNHILSHFLHSADVFTTTASPKIANNFFKQPLSFVSVLADNFHVTELHISSLVHKPPAEHLVFISPHIHYLGLKAPPVNFI